MDGITPIEHKAAAFLAQRDSGKWTDADEAALRGWLEAATLHRITFLSLESAWEESARLQAFAAGLPAGAGARAEWRLPVHFEAHQLGLDPEPIIAKERAAGERAGRAWPADASAERPVDFRFPSSRRRWIAMAASLLAAIGVGSWLVGSLPDSERFATAVGGLATQPLPDGSSIVLNTATSVRVELTDGERRVVLTRGEVFSEVAKDSARPFVVKAGRARVVALGTKFSVRREGGAMRVVVTEGLVRIEDAQGEHALARAGSVARLAGGEVEVQQHTVAETEELLSWRSGFLTFSDTSLAAAVREFNRYSRQPITVGDASIAGIPISGRFPATQFDAFVRLLRDGYGIRAEEKGRDIVLTQ